MRKQVSPEILIIAERLATWWKQDSISPVFMILAMPNHPQYYKFHVVDQAEQKISLPSLKALEEKGLISIIDCNKITKTVILTLKLYYAFIAHQS